jgi:hypothetical protein
MKNPPESGGTEHRIGCYRGTVFVRWRIRNYHAKGTLGGQMIVYADHLEFGGIGIYRLALREYKISKAEVDNIHPLRTAEPSRHMRFLPIRRFGILVVSKPGGAFRDRDEYTFRFNIPTLDEMFTMLREAGYPIAE